MPFIYSSQNQPGYETEELFETEDLPDEVVEGQTFSTLQRNFESKRKSKENEENNWFD